MDLHQAFPHLHASIPSDQDGAILAFLEGDAPYLPKLPVEEALRLPLPEVLQLLRLRLGGDLLRFALKRKYRVPSPVLRHRDGAWLERRPATTIDLTRLTSFWQIIPLAFTRAYHAPSLLLEGMWETEAGQPPHALISWHLRPDRFCEDLAQEYPKLNRPERQLVVVLNLLHALGKTVGFCLPRCLAPHSECVLGNPHLFAWRQGRQAVSERAAVGARATIFDWLWQQGSGVAKMKVPDDAGLFFSARQREKRRLKVLFGPRSDSLLRQRRRHALARRLSMYGYHPTDPFALQHAEPAPSPTSYLTYAGQKLRDLLRKYPFDFLQHPANLPQPEEGLLFLPQGQTTMLLHTLRRQTPFLAIC